MDRYEKESIVRGHHIYKSACTEEELTTKINGSNKIDQYTVAVVKDD